MTDRTGLEADILAAFRAHAALSAVMVELSVAQSHGNLDRIGNAAFDAQAAGDFLTAQLSNVFAGAVDLSAAAFDKALP
jgi:hypothetical protein